MHVTPCMPGALPASGLPAPTPSAASRACPPANPGAPGAIPSCCDGRGPGLRTGSCHRPVFFLAHGEEGRWVLGGLPPSGSASPPVKCGASCLMLNVARLQGSAPRLFQNDTFQEGRESELHSSTCAREKGAGKTAASSLVLPAEHSPDLFPGIRVSCLRGPVLPEGAQVRWGAGLLCGTEFGVEGSEPPLPRRSGEAGCSQAQTHSHKG